MKQKGQHDWQLNVYSRQNTSVWQRVINLLLVGKTISLAFWLGYSIPETASLIFISEKEIRIKDVEQKHTWKLTGRKDVAYDVPGEIAKRKLFNLIKIFWNMSFGSPRSWKTIFKLHIHNAAYNDVTDLFKRKSNPK
jgi:hypothetical protein